ncbi:bifunctional adenosylcobinamide kinase/adenosylcobinamide-phosphate guanylyltransferase [Anaeromassilibacillus senegalensis]|uniref:bifunctional adenosylcobinamide kinase/adenosylcobinamide-phosphate guanylyltransferase n=1 Tax=Anaeromassilibacillus senegalensis TaxID=1673717 RepID=UPI0006809D5A|nr:bifunctional adenosylcobinamide kinase/adenosylcobinamide-phosphate guanylyltransferase [Anaeromassilibacillus senegalensis]
MLTLVLGGAASGKSEYAEALVMKLSGTPRIYLATMQANDAESRARVERHIALREGKGFLTVECPLALEHVAVPSGSVVLLECMSNLLANECFSPDGAGKLACERILRGMDRLCQLADNAVVVSNLVFSDGMIYDASTMAYIARLARVNAALAQKADRLVEVVCSIPILHKGKGESTACV